MSSLTIALYIVCIAIIIASAAALLLSENYFKISKSALDYKLLLRAIDDIIHARRSLIDYISLPRAKVTFIKFVIYGRNLVIINAIKTMAVGERCKSFFELTPWLLVNDTEKCILVNMSEITLTQLVESLQGKRNIVTVYTVPSNCSVQGSVRVNVKVVPVYPNGTGYICYYVNDSGTCTRVGNRIIVLRIVSLCGS